MAYKPHFVRDFLVYSLSMHIPILVFFRRVRKIAKGEYYSRDICLSVRTKNLGYHWMDFHEI